MLWIAGLLFTVGLLFNAFCSAMETAFYRVARLRLILDAKQPGLVPWGLMWLSQRPAFVLAGLLLGVNIANYMVSISIVQVGTMLWGSQSLLVETVISALLTPLMFVYADLLPKTVAFSAPYSLLKRWAPLLFFTLAVLAPCAALLWALSQFLAYLLGESPQTTQENLARKELAKVFDEGHAAGILQPAQKRVAQEIVTAGHRQVAGCVTLLHRLPKVTAEAAAVDALRMAAQRNCPLVLVEDTLPGKPLLGYVRVLDVKLSGQPALPPVRPLLQLQAEDSIVAALCKLLSKEEPAAKVVNSAGTVLGLVFTDRLAQELHQANVEL